MNGVIQAINERETTLTSFSGTGTPVITDTQIPIVKNANFAIERLA